VFLNFYLTKKTGKASESYNNYTNLFPPNILATETYQTIIHKEKSSNPENKYHNRYIYNIV